MKPIKILAIQFKYLGDAVILTPALKALKNQLPNSELHVLVAAEVAPLLTHISWIDKVWAMPRKRGKAKLFQSWPFIKALRKERFNQCVDFGGNDRGALLSLLCGAPVRLGSTYKNHTNLIKKLGYTQSVNHENEDVPHSDLHFELLSAWRITRDQSLDLEIACNPLFTEIAKQIITSNTIIFHIATSQPKKDWPIKHWKKLYDLAFQARLKIIFSSGVSVREIKLLEDLKTLAPDAIFLPPITNLDIFLNVLKISKLVVAGDTGPLHFAAGLGVPVLGIFAVGNSLTQAAPIYNSDEIIRTQICACYSDFSNLDYCVQDESCMASIKPEAVFLKLQNILNNIN